MFLHIQSIGMAQGTYSGGCEHCHIQDMISVPSNDSESCQTAKMESF